MDIRAKRSRDKIINTFLKIRAKKRLEKITVTEICKSAQINKSTFYAHFHDVYDLSDFLETQMVEEILCAAEYPERLFENRRDFVLDLSAESMKRKELIDVLFSGDRYFVYAKKLADAHKKHYFEKYPEQKNDPEINIKLTYSTYGGFFAYFENQNMDADEIIKVISEINPNFI